MFQDFKSEIKLFLIVAAVSAALAIAGILLLQAGLRPSSPTPPPQASPSPQPQPSTSNIERWQTYRSEEYGFEVKYPPGSERMQRDYGYRISLPVEEEGTNLSEKYMDIAINTSFPHARTPEYEGKVSIGGNIFVKERDAGIAAGNLYDTEFYTINHEDTKFVVSFTLHSGNLGNYDPSIRPTAFNKEKESAIFDQILSTFRFVEE